MICMYIDELKQLKLSEEYISRDLKIYLARLLQNKLFSEEGSSERKIVLQNDIINMSLQIQGKPIYVLETQDEDYMLPEYAWHNAEFHLVFRRLDSTQTIELLGDLIISNYLSIKEINDLFKRHNITFKFIEKRNELAIEFLPEKEINKILENIDNEEEEEEVTIHDNILLLLKRLDQSLNDKDYTLTIATSASVFETLAKDIIDLPHLVNQSLGQFFSRYRNDSKLPSSVLDYMKSVFDNRNTTPTAGHGSTAEIPNITDTEAQLLVELTKAFVRVEYKLLAKETANKEE